jgi:hypothetical protein
MRLSGADRTFIDRRERRAKHWPLAGGLSLALVAAYAVWLWFKAPNLINPWSVAERLEAGTLSAATLGVMAVMLPVVMGALLVFAFVVVLLWFIPMRNERRLIRLIRELDAEPPAERVGGAP